jgi:hypothetical protein
MPALEDKIREILGRRITDPEVLVAEIAEGARDLLSDNCPEGGCYADI